MMIKATIIAGALAAIGLPLLAAGPASANPPHHFVLGTSGDDQLVGTKQSDIIIGFEGNDTLFGGRKSDALLGGYGDDTLFAFGRHSDTDLVRGGPGNDTCYVDATDKTIGCETIVIR